MNGTLTHRLGPAVRQSRPQLQHTLRLTGVRLLWICLIQFLCLGSTALAQDKTLDVVSLQLRYFHQFQFAGYYAALEKGYYRAAGLDVKILEGTGGNEAESKVLSGQADFGVGSSSLLVARAQGQPVVALDVVFQHSPFAIVTPLTDAAQVVQDLAGKRVMVEDQWDELFAYLKKVGVPRESLVRVKHSFNLDDLIKGRVDAMAIFVTNETDDLDKLGFPYQLYQPRTAGIDFYGDNLFTSEAQISQHPERVKAFRAASMRGWQYAMAHPEEIADLILQKYSKRNSREHLLYEAKQMVALVQPVLVEMGYMNPGRWRHIADTYAELGMVPAEFSLDGFLYNPNPPADLRWLYRILALLVAGLLVAVVIHWHRLKAERQKASLALRASEVRLRTMIEALPQQIWTADAQGKMDYVNRRIIDYFGLSEAELLSGALRRMVHPDDFSNALLQWEQARIAGISYVIDLRLRRYDGSYRWHMSTAIPLLDNQGRIERWFGSSLDISERKEAEDALLHMNELLEARVEERTTELRLAMAQIVESQKLASLGTLVAGVSHELNTPIGNIVMIASALSDRLTGFAKASHDQTLTRSGLQTSIAECQTAADIIVRSAHRASELIESFKRVSVDQTSQRRRQFDLRETVQDILNAMGPAMRRANASFDLSIEAGIVMDSFPGHLEQIISNLVLNSIKHGFEGRDAGCIRVSAQLRAEMIELVYEDDGQGIAEELQHRVFEPFYTTKLGQGGSGLGLSIVHNLTHAIFKGRLRLGQTVGGGLRLVFEWPRVTPHSGTSSGE